MIYKGLSSSKEDQKEKKCTKILPFEATERNLLQRTLLFLSSKEPGYTSLGFLQGKNKPCDHQAFMMFLLDGV